MTNEDVTDTTQRSTEDRSRVERHCWRQVGGFLRTSRGGSDIADGTSTIYVR